MQKDINIRKQEAKIKEMGRILGNLFTNIDNSKVNKDLKEIVERDMYHWNNNPRDYREEITLQDLVEFMYQISDCISPSENKI